MGPTATETDAGAPDTEALYRKHGGTVFALCCSLLRDRAEAEDAAQQVFLSAHRALLNGAAPREPLPWLLAVARHECYARFRRRAVAAVPAGDAPGGATADASVHALRAGELASIWDEVGRMPPAQREAFLLREIRGLTYGQLADELSLSRPSVRSLLLRARARLRRRLGDVVAGLGGAPWVQALIRLLSGGDAGSPIPAATKAAAVGVGALALVGGGSLVARHPPTPHADAGARHRGQARVRHVAAPRAGASAPRPTGSGDHSSTLERPSAREDGSRESSSGRTGTDDGSGGRSSSSGDGSSGSGHEGSDDTATVAQQPTTDGHDGGGSSSSGPGSDGGGSTSTSSSSGSGSGSTSDGDSSSTTTTVTTTSGSDGSGSDGSDGGGSSGHGG